MDLRLDNLSVAINGKALVSALTLDVPQGQVVGLIGPNGSGKSTALRCVYRALRPSGGVIRLGNDDLSALSLRATAQSIAALTQEASSDLDFTVEEMVALGRAPHLKGNRRLDAREQDLCARAMAQLDVAHLAHRGMLDLSGGERQRVMIARALVQEPKILVLDEPTNHLDMRHQIELLSLLKGSGLAVLVVLHDLNLAAACCDYLGVICDGRLFDAGTPREIMTPMVVQEVFGVDVIIVDHPLTGYPQLFYTLTSS
ncbi:ABC transporter ATP-binding protein [Pelagibacterium sp. H642]|uniref:ABC transporter ATP-binding protein n=1 Tax=Pelagibacterium sp. H642 TaxID=1881069 RepID=UPI0028150F1B|nr:ABC transporter ATP-binding protein [Pelagibacterium sp. H642]WMT92909.1 ABC transporter ATP-binding protein [Pelagibacterium sp. H642]